MTRSKLLSTPALISSGVVLASVVLLFAYENSDDRRIENGGIVSQDLKADLRLMRETHKITGDGTGVPEDRRYASTNRAINAASRVFNSVDLKGMTRTDVIATLGNPRTSSNSIYNFPFYPAGSDQLVYRFDSGSGGWQFNIHFDADGKFASVQRLGIE